MSTATGTRAWALLADVPDPEIPVVSVVDLGIVRAVDESPDGHAVTVTLTPTYSGCPATEVIAQDVRTALEAAYDDVRVETQLSPAWTTDWLSDTGRDKLAAYGIVPPSPSSTSVVDLGATIGRRGTPAGDEGHDGDGGVGRPQCCPRCGSDAVEELAGFGSTPCKALWRCTGCREPFDYMKRH